MGINSNIRVNDIGLGGVTSGAYRRSPWHGYGEVKDGKGRVVGIKRPFDGDPRTTTEILATGGIDWEPKGTLLSDAFLLPMEGADQFKAVYRPYEDGSMRLLGVHSDSYGILDNSTCAGFIEEILRLRSDATLLSITELFGGEILFANIEFRDGVQVTRRDGTDLDKHSPLMGVYWSHNGQYPLGVKYMRHEWVCRNTFTPWSADTGLVVRHTSRAEDRAADARRALTGMMTALTAFDQQVERLLRIEADRQTARDVARGVLGGRPEKEGRSQTMWDNAFDAIIAEWDEFTTQSSGFDVVMAVQGYEQHRKSTRGAAREATEIRRLVRDDFPMTRKAATLVLN